MFLLPEIALSLVILLCIYWALPRYLGRYAPQQVQNCVLLAYSVALFAWLAPGFLLVLVLDALLIIGLVTVVGANRTAGAKLAVTIAGITLSVLLLAAFKYYNPTREFLAIHGWTFASQLQPLGWVLGFSVSFLTFQYISLLVLWWRGGFNLGVKPLELALFVAFFPTLVAGPIIRAEQLLPQLTRPRRVIAPKIALARILLGVWQMLVCAQWLSDQWVSPIYLAPQSHHGLEVLAAALAYSLQIYLDFSGLSNIVVGIGWLLGLRLPRNFRSPYAARNIREFWRRWHMSLSNWIRDYLYKPLGGNRKGFIRAQLAVAVSMGLSGVWHGAALTFVVWAAMHITGVVVLNCLDRLRHWVLPKYLACTLTFLWVSAAWVFFRAESLDHAGAIFGGMFQSFSTTQPLVTYNLLGFSALLAGFFILQVKGPIWAAKIGRYWFKAPKWVFAVSLWFSLWLAIELGPSGVPNFIYAGF